MGLSFRSVTSKTPLSNRATAASVSADTEAAVARLERGVFEVTDRKDKPTTSRPSAPYITSTLQQAASTRLGFSVKKTMMLAQRLYEAGHITYMRTDSTNLSQEAVESCRARHDSTASWERLVESVRIYVM